MSMIKEALVLIGIVLFMLGIWHLSSFLLEPLVTDFFGRQLISLVLSVIATFSLVHTRLM
jgi:hypothetical protein